MSWPTPQEYNEAIQSPTANFLDADLRAAKPTLTPLGLPLPVTGNFASVYRMQRGKETWAARCFWRDFPDIAHRYERIAVHLQQSRLSQTVGFDYLPTGIRVRGRWYPSLKMEWVEGVPLHRWVESYLHHPHAVQDLRMRWEELMSSLESASMAHGDLQHGNVLVAGERLMLVDYDGMYVPALRGMGSHELGHPNYQHPRRSQSDFGPALDRFSAGLIYLSLLALETDPALWHRFGGGDERLLFGKDDFLDPESSQLWLALSTHSDARLRRNAAAARSFLDVAPSRIPPVPEWARDEQTRFQVPRLFSPRIPLTEARTTTTLPLWLRDSVGSETDTVAGHRSRRQRFLVAPCIALLWRARSFPRHLFDGSRRRGRVERRLRARQDEVRSWLDVGLAALVSLAEEAARCRAVEESEALRMFQETFVHSYLRRQRLPSAGLPDLNFLGGVYPWLHRIRTAADVVPQRACHLDRLGPRTAAAILGWALEERTRARRKAPSSLPEPILSRIDRPFDVFEARVTKAVKRAKRDAERVLNP